MSLTKQGSGLPLTSLYKLLYSGKVGTVWKRTLKAALERDTRGAVLTVPPEDVAALGVAVRALASSREFKELWPREEVELDWRAVGDPVAWVGVNVWRLNGLKKWLERKTGARTPTLSAASKKFLREWVGTDGKRLPYVTKDVERELLPFRPTGPVVLYRGIRFSGTGALVAFHEEYGEGKPFKFNSNRFSSWSRSARVAENFARLRPSSSQGAGMMGWFSRVKDQKDYDGAGGYVLSCYARPESCLVDLNHPDIPDWGWTGRGNEGEVILLPDQTLVTKVFKTVGDPGREVQEFLNSRYDKPRSPTQKEFWDRLYLGGDVEPQVVGDEGSGTVTLVSDDPAKTRESLDRWSSFLDHFTRNLYRAEWTGVNTLTYRALKLPGDAVRVAQRWLGGGAAGGSE